MVAVKVALLFGFLSVLMLASSAAAKSGGGNSGGDSESNIANIASFTNFNKFGQNLGDGSFPGVPGGHRLSPETIQDFLKLASDPCTMTTLSQLTKLMSDVNKKKGSN